MIRMLLSTNETSSTVLSVFHALSPLNPMLGQEKSLYLPRDQDIVGKKACTHVTNITHIRLNSMTEVKFELNSKTELRGS